MKMANEKSKLEDIANDSNSDALQKSLTSEEITNAWKYAMQRWNNPSVQKPLTPRTEDELSSLGEMASALKGQLAFMKFPEFQVYANLERIAEDFAEDPRKALNAVFSHEIGHKFCPYDMITSIILRTEMEKALKEKKLPYDSKAAANNILNLFTDMCINTNQSKKGNKDIEWLYQKLSKKNAESSLWKVYARSMEIAWNTEIMPKEEPAGNKSLIGKIKGLIGKKQKSHDPKKIEPAAQSLAEIFKEGYFDSKRWREKARDYAMILSDFLEKEEKDGKYSLDNIAGNIPEKIDEKTAREIAKRMAEIGSNGIPTNPKSLEEFKGIMAGFGHGDPVEASILFYDLISDAYAVSFASRPFGKPRQMPFQPEKWQPSMGASELDIDYSLQFGGKIIPGINTYSWKSRKRERMAGLEEVVPNLDLYEDSSLSMPDPVETLSLPVLAAFVTAKKAHRKGALVRATNYSGNGQYETQEFTNDLHPIFKVLVKSYRGGTVLPVEKLAEGADPRQILIITDADLGNESETADAIREAIKKDKRTKAAVYAIGALDTKYLSDAGAQVILGNDTQIFKGVIGKSSEVYEKC